MCVHGCRGVDKHRGGASQCSSCSAPCVVAVTALVQARGVSALMARQPCATLLVGPAAARGCAGPAKSSCYGSLLFAVGWCLRSGTLLCCLQSVNTLDGGTPAMGTALACHRAVICCRGRRHISVAHHIEHVGGLGLVWQLSTSMAAGMRWHELDKLSTCVGQEVVICACSLAVAASAGSMTSVSVPARSPSFCTYGACTVSTFSCRNAWDDSRCLSCCCT